MASAVEEKVKQIIVEQLGVDEGEVTQNASFVDDLGADSLDTVELVMAFEEAFDIEIPDEDAEKIRTVQEGSFLRSGGANVTFSQQVNGNRVDITISRAADATGVSGTGLLAAILFDAVAPGTGTLTLSGSGTGPGNTAMALQFRPVSLVVQ